jgi:uncharacterized membrane protein YqgA involved in biofilm formation
MINAVAILAGGIAGLMMSKQLSPAWQSRIKIGLAIFTVLVGTKMMWRGINGSFGSVVKQLTIVVLAVMFGHLLGRIIGIQKALGGLGQYAKERFAKAQSDGTPPPSEGFITCTLLFCVGPMSVLGSFQDGISGDYQTLLIKSVMDGFAAMAFASTFGWGVLLSILPVVAYQGTITLCAQMIKPHMTDRMIDSLTATGGMIVFCIPIIILELRKVPLADYLPSLILAPLLTWWWN